MKILILQITLLLEIAKYMLGMQLGFKSKFKRWQFIPIGMLVYFVCISLNDFTIPEEYVLMYLTSYVLVILMNTARVWKRIVHFFFIFLIILALDEVTGLGVRLMLGKYNNLELMSYLEYFFSNVASFVIVAVISFVVKMKRLQKSNIMTHYIKDKIYIWLILMIIEMLFTTTVLSFAKKYIDNEKFQIYVTILSIFTYLGIVVISLFLLLMRNNNLKLVEIVTAERELGKLQANYYKMLLEREEDTRKYRHDTLNHLSCITALIKNKDLDAVSEYISDMHNQLIKIKEKSYDVGNEIINIFINNYLVDLNDTIKVVIVGKCIKEIDLSDIDMCIIFSNLIQNAVEEINKSDQENRFIVITIQSGMDYVKFQIANSISVNEGIKNRLFHRSKKFDHKNHGHGLNNVTNVLNRNNLELGIDITDNKFQATFILKYRRDHSRS